LLLSPLILIGVASGWGDAVVSRSISMELRMPSSLAAAAAAMSEIRRRSSSGGRLSGCDSWVREVRLDEKKPVFEAVDDERLCEVRSGYESDDDLFLRGDDDDVDFVGELESEGSSGGGLSTPSEVRSLLRGLGFLSLSLRMASAVSSSGLGLPFSFFLLLSGALEKS
jgi:hypothetical protein